jgi:hypothetical protein
MINMQDKNFLIRIKKFEKILDKCAKARLGISIYRLKRYILYDAIGLDPKYHAVVEIYDPEMVSRRRFSTYKASVDYSKSDYSDIELREEFKAIDIQKYLKGKRKKGLTQSQLEEKVMSLVVADPNSDFNFTWFLFLGKFYNICKGYGIDGSKSVVFLP